MAGRFSIETVFKAVDRMTAPVSKMQRRVGRFTKGMERGLRRVNRVTGKVTRALKTGLRAGVMAVGVAVTGLALQIRGLASEADDLAKRTRRLKFPIEEFQNYEFIAQQAGVSSEMFAKGMDAFSKRLGEAKAGTGTMVTLLKKMNPELLKQITNTKDSSESLRLIIGAMRDMEDPTKRAALGAAAFSRTAGIKMAQMADLSADAIARLRAEQIANGNITQKQAEQAEAYNDAMNSLKRALRGFRADVLSPLLPQLTELLGSLREWTIANRELISKRVLAFFTNVRENFGQIVTWLKRIGIGLAVWFTFITVLKTFIAVMTAVNLVMAMNPIGLIVLGVMAAIAAISALVFWFDEIKAWFLDLPGWGKVAFMALLGPIGMIIGAASLLIENWEKVKTFFVNTFTTVRNFFDDMVFHMTNGIEKVADFFNKLRKGNFNAAFKVFAGSDDPRPRGSLDAGGGTAGGQMVTPQERIVRSMTESNARTTNEVVIRDETGRAEQRGPKRPGVLRLEPTGAF